MFKKIEWIVFLKVTSKQKADKVLHRFSEALGQEISIIKCEQYWKDKSLFRAQLESPLGSDEISEAVFETLRTCSKIANRWIVNAPQGYEENKWEFHGGADSRSGFHVVGLVETDFRITNED